MRILHTSDWHLGVSTGPVSRHTEQQLFLDWLLEALSTHKVDALIVAGDVFDTMHPSSEAQALYFQFLSQIAQTGTRDVVIVGGNHDSAARLDAPRALLKSVGVHVVGGVPTAEARNARMLAPLRARGSDDIKAVCLAVPYVHEYRLGIRTTDLDRTQTRAAFREEFSKLYSGLADHANATYPGVPLIATGHLTLGTGSTREDYPQQIHQVGNIEGLPVEILDPRVRYTALGHIHRCYPVKGSTAWYSGSPIPYSLTEMGTKRHVLLVEVEAEAEAEVKVERLEVPRHRDLVELIGPPQKVLSDLRALTWTTRLAPLVHVRVETQLAEPGLIKQLHDAVPANERSQRPVLVDVQQRATVAPGGPQTDVLPTLDAMQPEGVFEMMCQRSALTTEDGESLKLAFDTVRTTQGKLFDTLLDDIYRRPTSEGGAK